MTIKARFGLRDINFLEVDSKKITDDIISNYEKITNRSLAKGDSVRLYLLSLAYVIIQLRQAVNLGCRQNLLTYADDAFLDHLGSFVNTPRLESIGAKVTVKFTLTEVQTSVYVVPKGTKVTDGNITFETDKVLEIEVGKLDGEITATASDKGTQGNDINVGFINKFVDQLPYMQKVENIDISTGGADREDDELYAERIRLAPGRFSVAGPYDAYEFYARTYGGTNMIDVSIYGKKDDAGKVFIHPLLKNQVLPNKAFIDGMYEFLNDEKIRPLTDELIITAPTRKEFNIELTYFIATSDLNRVKQIQEQVELAVEQYRQDQQNKIGLDLNPDMLIRNIREAGAKRSVVIRPSFTPLEKDEVAYCPLTNVKVTYGGSEDL